jgi:hypothetical protein
MSKFDPDKFLASRKNSQPAGFDPDEFLRKRNIQATHQDTVDAEARAQALKKSETTAATKPAWFGNPFSGGLGIPAARERQVKNMEEVSDLWTSGHPIRAYTRSLGGLAGQIGGAIPNMTLSALGSAFPAASQSLKEMITPPVAAVASTVGPTYNKLPESIRGFTGDALNVASTLPGGSLNSMVRGASKLTEPVGSAMIKASDALLSKNLNLKKALPEIKLKSQLKGELDPSLEAVTAPEVLDVIKQGLVPGDFNKTLKNLAPAKATFDKWKVMHSNILFDNLTEAGHGFQPASFIKTTERIPEAKKVIDELKNRAKQLEYSNEISQQTKNAKGQWTAGSKILTHNPVTADRLNTFVEEVLQLPKSSGITKRGLKELVPLPVKAGAAPAERIKVDIYNKLVSDVKQKGEEIFPEYTQVNAEMNKQAMAHATAMNVLQSLPKKQKLEFKTAVAGLGLLGTHLALPLQHHNPIVSAGLFAAPFIGKGAFKYAGKGRLSSAMENMGENLKYKTTADLTRRVGGSKAAPYKLSTPMNAAGAAALTTTTLQNMLDTNSNKRKEKK